MEIQRLLRQMFKLKSCHKKILQKKTAKKNDEAQACASIHVDSVKKNKTQKGIGAHIQRMSGQ